MKRDIQSCTGRIGEVLKKGKNGIYNRYIKRILDIFCAALVFLLFGWVYIILALLVRIKLGSPVIFHQPRPGMTDPQTGEEKIFNLCKFRSMTDERDESGELLPDEVRLTKFGKILRATSLDELPEAWNVLKGEMSWIGPRPLLTKYLPYYTEREHLRHSVRPGITGLSQVNGRNFLEWDKRLEMDVEYVENVSFLLDLKIIFSTVYKVIKRADVSEARIVPLDEERSAAKKEEV